MIFTLIGIGLASLAMLFLGVCGLAIAFFNNIGGNGSRRETLGGLLFAGVMFAGGLWVWTYSPFTIVVTP